MVQVLELLGPDRAFELLELLIVLFVLLSLAMLVMLFVHSIRSRRALRRTNARLDEIVGYLGRNLFGEHGWSKIESATSARGNRLESRLSLFDPSGFERWARKSIERGLVESDEIDELRERFARHSGDGERSIDETGPPECTPTSGMPIAIRQGEAQVRGTIDEVEQHSLTVLVPQSERGLDGSLSATVMMLSQSGSFVFESRIERLGAGRLRVERPQRILRAQRRRFTRRLAALPVTVKDYLGKDRPTKAVMNELSSGGASLTNPNGAYRVGDVLAMSFDAGRRHHTVAGRVVRTSSDQARLHVQFEVKDQQGEDTDLMAALTELS